MTKSIVSPFSVKHREYYPLKIDNVDHSALSGSLLLVNTSNNSVDITLPSSPKSGDTLKIIDIYGTFRTNNCTIKMNGEKYFNSTNDIILNTDYIIATFYYVSTSIGWIIDISNMILGDNRILEVKNDITLINNNYMLLVDTTSNSVNITLPSSPLLGAEIKIIDIGGVFSTNNCIIVNNDKKINNKSENYILKSNNATTTLIYNGKDNWLISNSSSDSAGDGDINYIKVLHTNIEDITNSTEYVNCFNCEILPDPTRIDKSNIKFILSLKGSGNYKIVISDGTNEVNYESSNVNYDTYTIEEALLDCSSLSDISTNKSWNINIYFKTNSNTFYINRILCKIKNISPFILNNLISNNLYVDCYSNKYELLDYGYIPSNVIQDSEYRIKFIIQMNSVDTTGSCKIKLSAHNLDTKESTFEESVITYESGNFIKSAYVYLPMLVSTQIKYEIFGKVDTIGKFTSFKNYELNLEI